MSIRPEKLELNSNKINEIEEKLKSEIDDLESRSKKYRLSAADRVRLEQCHDRWAALNRIITRNIVHLPSVRSVVFVSTPFSDDGKPEVWVKEVQEKVNILRLQKKLGEYVWTDGGGTGNLRTGILSKIVEAHYFLCIVPRPGLKYPANLAVDESGTPASISPWLMEELGAACSLSKLTVVAVEKMREVKPEDFGRLFSRDLGRVVFDRKEPDWQDDFAMKLADALEKAAKDQTAESQDQHKLLKRVVG